MPFSYVYRPEGVLDWLLPRLTVPRWDVLSGVGSEGRCLSAWRTLKMRGRLLQYRLIEVTESRRSRYSEDRSRLVAQHLAEFARLGADDSTLRRCELLGANADIVALADDFLGVTTGSVVFDVSVLPKRFFFPILRRLWTATDDSGRPLLRDLVLTYTVPRAYPVGPLSENASEWASLPLFGGAYRGLRPEMFILSIGFDALGLQARVEQESGLPLRMLIPFPGSPARCARAWEVMRLLVKNRKEESYRVYRVRTTDVSDAFDRLCILTQRGARGALLAPFGPKPVSIAFALFAILTDMPVYYTQPVVYRPDYSIGESEISNVPETHAYCLRLGGIDQYKVS